MKRTKIGPNSSQGFTLSELLIVATIVLIIGSIMFGATGGGGHFSASYFGKLFKVVWQNVGFWILLLIAVIFGLYRKITNPVEFMWRELPIQLGVSFLSLLILFSIFFTTATDLSDTEIWNGHVTLAEYYEEWTEEHTSTDEDGNTTTTHTYHAPEWKLLTTAGNCDVSQEIYQTYRRQYGNETEKNLFRSSQSSIGDGDMYYVDCEVSSKAIMPASRPHRFINYLRASDSIRKIQGGMLGFTNLLVQYPTVYNSNFGPIEVDRVIEAGVKAPTAWKNAVENLLDKELVKLGPQKEVNVLVYLVGTKDVRFAEALKEKWVHGKKNDVIVVIGTTEFPYVDWAQIISWTKVEEFKINLRNGILDLKDISHASNLVRLITEEIRKPGNKGGFVRPHMKEFEYLIGDISLPIWCQFLIVILGGTISWFTSYFLVNNRWRNYTGYSSRKTSFDRFR